MIKIKQIENLQEVLDNKLNSVTISDVVLASSSKNITLINKTISPIIELNINLYTADLDDRYYRTIICVHDNTTIISDIINENYYGNSETDISLTISLTDDIILNITNNSIKDYNIKLYLKS